MNLLILAQIDREAGKGHFNRSRILFKKIKKIKYLVDFLLFKSKNNYFYDENFTRLKKKYYLQKINDADVIITDEISCSKGIIQIIKKKFICSISPIGRVNKFADIIFSRPMVIKKYNKKTYIDSDITNFLPGSEMLKIYKKDFIKQQKIKKKIVGISMGGYDKNNKTIKTIKILKKLKNSIAIKVLINSADSRAFQKISMEIKKLKMDVKIYSMNKSTWAIFSNCSMVILSGGISAYESIFAGIPSLNIINSSSKKKLTTYLEKKKLTKILSINKKKEIFNFINYYIFNNKELIKYKNRIDNFTDRLDFNPYLNLIESIKKAYKNK